MLRLHVAVILFGLSGVLGRWLDIPATAIVLGRTALAAITLVLVLGSKEAAKQSDFRWSRGVKLLPSGLLLAIHWCTFFVSIQVSSVATGLLSFATFPIFVALLDPLFSRKRIRNSDLIFAVLVLCGLVLVVPSYDFGNRFFRGALWGLASALTFALLTLFNKRFVSQVPALHVGLFQNLWAAIFFSPFYSPLFALNLTQIAVLLVLGILCTALAHTLFISALTTVRPQLASVTAGLEPVYGILLALFLLGEIPSAREVIGGLLIVVVVALNSMRDLQTQQVPA